VYFITVYYVSRSNEGRHIVLVIFLKNNYLTLRSKSHEGHYGMRHTALWSCTHIPNIIDLSGKTKKLWSGQASLRRSRRSTCYIRKQWNINWETEQNIKPRYWGTSEVAGLLFKSQLSTEDRRQLISFVLYVFIISPFRSIIIPIRFILVHFSFRSISVIRLAPLDLLLSCLYSGVWTKLHQNEAVMDRNGPINTRNWQITDPIFSQFCHILYSKTMKHQLRNWTKY
jgi:hypothetical protein